ncbi:hypothetical protein FXO37_08512 [Capsicum annuum]|nr:hypothetical protein FXO37_08512 [Capsicum annuum]
MFGSFDIHLAISNYLSIALYFSEFILDGIVEGGKLFNDMSSSKVGVQTGRRQLSRPLPKQFFSALLLDFIAQVDQLIEIAKEFDFNGMERFKIRSECKIKLQVLHPPGYTYIVVIETIYLVVCHILHYGLANVLVYTILLNKCAVAGQVITELNLILLMGFTGNKEKHGCNWLIAVTMERFGREGAFKSVHWYLKMDNFSFDRSERVTEYCQYHISSAPRASFDPNSTLDDILSIPLFNTNAYSLADYVIMSFGREGIDAKKA